MAGWYKPRVAEANQQLQFANPKVPMLHFRAASLERPHYLHLDDNAIMAARKPVFNQQVLYDTTPLPDSIPAVKEVGATSAPLLSASFFIGARCRPYNDDYMQCKTENPGKGEFECLKEGRRVTRCASSVIDDINKQCLEEFRKHWQCLDNNNHQLWQCRKPEWKLNQCVFDNLKLEKTIPDAPKDQIPVHLRTRQIYAHYPILRDPGQPSFGKSIDPPSAKAQAEAPAS